MTIEEMKQLALEARAEFDKAAENEIAAWRAWDASRVDLLGEAPQGDIHSRWKKAQGARKKARRAYRFHCVQYFEAVTAERTPQVEVE